MKDPRSNHEEMTDFGFAKVPCSEKAEKVADVFDSVAPSYDLMNDLMSLGLHRIWKHMACCYGGFRKGQTVLDLATGTGDLALKIAPRIGPEGRLIMADININMLQQGYRRLLDRGFYQQVTCVQADAQYLPFKDNFFDRIVIGFGLRNVTDKAQALASMYRTLKPGGRCLILEFSKPRCAALASIYDQYSFKILPLLGEWIAKDAQSYRYLAESIRMHPGQEALLGMMREAGFEQCGYYNLTGGIVALHRGYKT